MSKYLTHICDRCREEIPAGDGFLYVNKQTAAKYLKDPETFRFGSLATSVGNKPAHWSTVHDKCYPETERSPYNFEIPVSRVQTHEALLGWLAHLLPKPWFCSTGFESIIRQHISQENIDV